MTEHSELLAMADYANEIELLAINDNLDLYNRSITLEQLVKDTE